MFSIITPLFLNSSWKEKCFEFLKCNWINLLSLILVNKMKTRGATRSQSCTSVVAYISHSRTVIVCSVLIIHFPGFFTLNFWCFTPQPPWPIYSKNSDSWNPFLYSSFQNLFNDILLSLYSAFSYFHISDVIHFFLLFHNFFKINNFEYLLPYFQLFQNLTFFLLYASFPRLSKFC